MSATLSVAHHTKGLMKHPYVGFAFAGTCVNYFTGASEAHAYKHRK